MNSIDNTMRQSALFRQVTDEIETGSFDQAVKMIMGLADRREQLAVLLNLAIDLTLILAVEGETARTCTHTLFDTMTSAIELVDSNASEQDIINAFKGVIARNIDLQQAISHIPDIAFPGKITGAINDVLYSIVRH